MRIDIESHGARLRISVSNPAPAIPPDEQTHLFERHWRGSNARHSPGAGLGLYLVRRIADKLGGSVALHYQAAGQGAQLLRVHDIAENRQALRVWRGLRDAALTS